MSKSVLAVEILKFLSTSNLSHTYLLVSSVLICTYAIFYAIYALFSRSRCPQYYDASHYVQCRMKGRAPSVGAVDPEEVPGRREGQWNSVRCGKSV